MQWEKGEKRSLHFAFSLISMRLTDSRSRSAHRDPQPGQTMRCRKNIFRSWSLNSYVVALTEAWFWLSHPSMVLKIVAKRTSMQPLLPSDTGWETDFFVFITSANETNRKIFLESVASLWIMQLASDLPNKRWQTKQNHISLCFVLWNKVSEPLNIWVSLLLWLRSTLRRSDLQELCLAKHGIIQSLVKTQTK